MTNDMTEGKIIPQLTGFTIPLILGNLFQLTYNAADSVIVGKFVGDDALAAVGTAGPVMNMVILFISGMCMGAGILMSTQYGGKEIRAAGAAGQYSDDRRAWFFCGGHSPSAGLCPSFARSPSGAAGHYRSCGCVSADHLRRADLYLYIQFLFQYAQGSGGQPCPSDLLIISAALNVVLDLFFVLTLGWGVPGSALATVLSEALCCLFCLGYIRKRCPCSVWGKVESIRQGRAGTDVLIRHHERTPADVRPTRQDLRPDDRECAGRGFYRGVYRDQPGR